MVRDIKDVSYHLAVTARCRSALRRPTKVIRDVFDVSSPLPQPLYKTRNSQLAPQCQPHPPHPLVILSLLLLLLFCSRVSGLGSLSWTPPSCELRVASFMNYQAGLPLLSAEIPKYSYF